ncbi:MAG: ABC transporter permease [Actinomycetota bacterium]|nr:ABC transporter permease [Actinomycetota bacterium]
MIFGQVADWFLDGSHWRGADGVPTRLLEHLTLSVEAIVIACLLALPLALVLGHLGRGGFLAVNVSNIGRALPSFAILVLAAQLPAIGIGNVAALIALVALAVPPLVTNTYVGVRAVDPDIKEAARGMGLSGSQVLRRVELPLAMPLVLAGLRTSAVQVIATATLAAYVSAGGLGRYIVDGFAQADTPKIYAGALLVALLALVVELGLGLLQRRLSPVAREGGVPAAVRAGPGTDVTTVEARPVGSRR